MASSSCGFGDCNLRPTPVSSSEGLAGPPAEDAPTKSEIGTLAITLNTYRNDHGEWLTLSWDPYVSVPIVGMGLVWTKRKSTESENFLWALVRSLHKAKTTLLIDKHSKWPISIGYQFQEWQSGLETNEKCFWHSSLPLRVSIGTGADGHPEWPTGIIPHKREPFVLTWVCHCKSQSAPVPIDIQSDQPV